MLKGVGALVLILLFVFVFAVVIWNLFFWRCRYCGSKDGAPQDGAILYYCNRCRRIS